MRKLLITILLILLLVLAYFTIFDGISIGDLHVLSASGIVKLNDNLTIKIEDTKLYQWIAPNSFGIYLFHAMIIYWLEFLATPCQINPYLLSVAVFAISLTLSILLTIAVRKLGLEVIIGEKSK